jgi:hypothetical protein
MPGKEITGCVLLFERSPHAILAKTGIYTLHEERLGNLGYSVFHTLMCITQGGCKALPAYEFEERREWATKPLYL